jgi:hypothetical protein
MKLKNLIKHLGDQLNIPIEELQKFDLNTFVEDSIKVASGELKSLKVNIYFFVLLKDCYVFIEILQILPSRRL